MNAPVLSFGGAPPPPPYPGQGATVGCDAQRVLLAGGAIQSMIMHPSVTPFEQLYRRLPEEGMFAVGVSPTKPFSFELGAFRVPGNMALMLFDLRPDIYRFSGIDAGDFVPVEARRFGSIMGFEITVDQKQPANIQFQVNPVPVQRGTPQAYTPPISQSGQQVQPQSTFNIATASGFGAAAGPGLSLMPQRPTRYGPMSVPFTLFARSGQTVQVRCVIFRRIPSPIAFIEYDIAGMMMPEQTLDAMLGCMSPDMGSSSGRRGPR